jgi:hypothetical protein
MLPFIIVNAAVRGRLLDELTFNGWGALGMTYSLVFILSLWPLRRRRMRAARAANGHCRLCGYDLRATPHRCPECGAMAIGRKTND